MCYWPHRARSYHSDHYIRSPLNDRDIFLSVATWPAVYIGRWFSQLSFRHRETLYISRILVNATLPSIHSVFSRAGLHFVIVPCMNMQLYINLRDVKCNKRTKSFPSHCAHIMQLIRCSDLQLTVVYRGFEESYSHLWVRFRGGASLGAKGAKPHLILL
jgi:hypothetical protein